MNSSLQQRWKAVQSNKGGTARDGEAQPQPGQAAAGQQATTANRFSTEVTPPSNTNLTSSGTGQAAGAEGGASNQELNKRLTDLRAKLANLRKP